MQRPSEKHIISSVSHVSLFLDGETKNVDEEEGEFERI